MIRSVRLQVRRLLYQLLPSPTNRLPLPALRLEWRKRQDRPVDLLRHLPQRQRPSRWSGLSPSSSEPSFLQRILALISSVGMPASSSAYTASSSLVMGVEQAADGFHFPSPDGPPFEGFLNCRLHRPNLFFNLSKFDRRSVDFPPKGLREDRRGRGCGSCDAGPVDMLFRPLPDELQPAEAHGKSSLTSTSDRVVAATLSACRACSRV